MTRDKLRWYVQRLRSMSATEVCWRCADHARKTRWRNRQVADPLTVLDDTEAGWAGARAGDADDGDGLGLTWADAVAVAVPAEARQALLEVADELLEGRWTILGVNRKDLDDPDWFYDPVSGRRAPARVYCFSIDSRDPAVTGDVKQVWELSRLHHLTILSAAFAVSGDTRYAERVAAQLRSWWQANGFLSGIHWTSGIEIGIRLISFVWIRRLLGSWGEVEELFERNPLAHAQIRWHQLYLEGFRSQGSSANNHVVAEAAGQLVASLAFPWFDESVRWEAGARALLVTELANNTFPSGLNREMATDYHRLVAELALVALAEADRAGRPLPAATVQLLCDMLDAGTAMLDARLQPPRQGDSDDGRALMLDDAADPWTALLALGRMIVGAPGWWPDAPAGVTSTLVGAVARSHHHEVSHRETRASHFADAGLTILRARMDDGDELWCRCDAGPHGFLSTAAHAHADALSIEVRHDGTELLVDPGTYCYQGHAAWRRYFRSTLSHNTIEVAGRDQSESGGPTLWTRHADTRLLHVRHDRHGEVVEWKAEHDGYLRHDPRARHRRTVEMSADGSALTILDDVAASRRVDIRLAWHVGPDVDAVLRDGRAELIWSDRHGMPRHAALHLAPGLAWSCHKGDTDPVLGWYSRRFGHKEPSTSIVGHGHVSAGAPVELRTSLVVG